MLKRRFIVLLILTLVSLSGCLSSGRVVELDTPPALSVSKDKALLIVYRPSRFSAGQETEIFLDNKLIGVTQGMQGFVYAVEPGFHYFMAVAENENITKFKLSAGKVYYVSQAMYPGVFTNRTEVGIMNPAEFNENRNDIQWVELVPEEAGASYEGWDQLVTDLEEDIAKNPGMYDRFLTMPGY